MLDRLLGALPEQNDLAPLRQALMRASRMDETRVWSRSSDYATFDKRVVNAGSLNEIVQDALKIEHARIDALYASVREILQFAAAGDDVRAGMKLIELGEAAEAEEDVHAAAAYYQVATQFSEKLADRSVRMLALRRLARTYYSRGDLERAIELYRASLEQAVSTANVEAQVAALIALGNMNIYQGKWQDSLQYYGTARNLCGEDFPLLQCQIAINVAYACREQGDLSEAAAQLEAASEHWSLLDSAGQSVWYNNRGLLALARGDLELAETTFRQALGTAGNVFDRAMVADNLAELYIRRGNLSDAEVFARSAEEIALRGGSPRALAEIYTRLGKIFRMRADLNGVTFFEKALELCRGHTYPLTEANAYLEYGIFRRILGDHDEARSFFERARDLAASIGAAQLERVAMEQLAQN